MSLASSVYAVTRFLGEDACMTYLDRGDNADWTKQTLDLFIPDGAGSMRRVASCDDVREYLRESGMTVEDYKRSPAYRLALTKQPWLREL